MAFLMSIVADVLSYFICKWLDDDGDRSAVTSLRRLKPASLQKCNHKREQNATEKLQLLVAFVLTAWIKVMALFPSSL